MQQTEKLLPFFVYLIFDPKEKKPFFPQGGQGWVSLLLAERPAKHKTGTIMNAELAQERREREERRKLVDELNGLINQLEQATTSFENEVQSSETAGTIGKNRSRFQEQAKNLNNQGTTIILRVDSIQASSKGERDRARADRKKLVHRIQSCSTRVSAFV